MFRQQLVTRVLTTLAIAITLGALSPVTAQDIHIINDDVKINFGTADFGDKPPPHALGSPSAPAMVVWC